MIPLRPLVEPGGGRQATDRAHRIGPAQSPVQVHRLIAEGTIEDPSPRFTRPRELADAIVSTSEAAPDGSTSEDLAELVRLRNAG